MDVRLLGPLEVDIDDEPVAIGGPRIRRLFVSMTLAGGSVRSIDSLIDAVWADEEPPEQARRTLMSYVSRLRSAVGEGMVEQIEHGYRLNGGIVRTDLQEFERLVGEGQHAARSGNHIHAAALFDEALGLWRGEPLAEFAGEHWAEPERSRLLALHLAAVEGRFSSRVELGDHAEILSELERAADDHPEQERLQYLHMLALYRSGRQADALDRFKSARRHLAELGLEPSPDLRELEYRILTHEEDLHGPGPEPGSVVRGYRLGARLGEGSFGAVYQATQPSVGREVAIKVIKPELANDPRFVRRFETEAQLVARLEHPHIVPLYDYWRDPGGAFLVMRLLRGGSAEERLVTDGPFALPAAAQIVDEIGGALAAAHARGVIHRDVKPGNVLFDEDGVAYLADFGIAVQQEELGVPADLRSAGSPLYASPEQVRAGDSSVRSDIYAFGVTIYELLTGRSAFPADSVDTLLERKLAAPVPSVSVDRPELPRAVDAVLAKATAVDPEARFEGIADFVLAFRAALAVEPPAIDTSERVGTATTLPEERPPRSLASATLVSVQLGSMNPYKGLRAFQEADAQDFYGRDRLIDELVQRIEQRRLVAVVGASGSGKSSLVRAGLVPRIQDREWFVATMVPGSHPFEELEDALLSISTGEVPGVMEQLTASDRGIARAVRRVLPPGDSELLLLIDQFEEVFTLADPTERDAFLAGLVEAVGDNRSRIRLVVTVRADFFDRPLRHRGFGERIQDATLNVLPMSREQLTAAIEGPARRLGGQFEPGLVDAIIADVGESAGVLPLLQYALTELYDQRDGNELTLRSYREIGGVTGALAQRAEEVYSELPAEDQEGARRLFTRLVTPGEGVEDTRRRAVRSELTVCSDAVIDAFGDHRLLSFDRDPATREPTVEVAHEALIREWQQLREWLDDDRQGLRVLRHLTVAARAWNDADRDPGELYRGGRLDAALEWATGHDADLAADERDFLDASRALRDAELMQEAERNAQRERQNRRLRRSLVGLGVVAVLALVATAVALQQRGSASDRADEAAAARAAAETRRLVSDAAQLAPTNRQVALLLAAEAHHRQPDAASLGALKDVLAASTDVLGYVGAEFDFADVTWTRDGRIIGSHPTGVVVLGPDGTSEFDIDLAGADELAVGGNDRVLAVAGSDSTVRLFDLTSGDQLTSPLDHGSPVEAVAYSGDGRVLVTGDRRGVVRVYDEEYQLTAEIDAFVDVDPTDLGAEVPPPLPHDPVSFVEGVIDVAVSDDGGLVAAVGGTEFALWDLRTGTVVERAAVTRVDGAFERLAVPTGIGFIDVDGVERLVAAEFFSASIHDVESGERIDRWTLSEGISQIAANPSVAFIDDRVITALDGTVQLAGADGSSVVLDSQLGGLRSVAAGPDDRVVVAGEDGALVLSLAGRGLISRSIETTEEEVGVSVDGQSVVTTCSEGTRTCADLGGVRSRLWALSGDRYEEIPMPEPSDVWALTGGVQGFSYDEVNATFQLRDPATMEPFGPAYGPVGAVAHEHSPDGRLLTLGATTLSPNGLVVDVYDRESGNLVARLGDFATTTSLFVRSLEFTPDGSRLLVATDDGRAVFYDTATWEQVGPELSAGGGAVVQAAYSNDGATLATVSADGAVTLRDSETLQPDGPPLLGNTDGVEGFSSGPHFSENDRWLVTSADGDLRLFDLEERALVGEPFPRDEQIAGSASVNARFGSTTFDGVSIIWTIDPESWPEIACRAAGRNLTPDEWAQFGPAGEPYRATCDQWPSLSDQTDGGAS